MSDFSASCHPRPHSEMGPRHPETEGVSPPFPSVYTVSPAVFPAGDFWLCNKHLRMWGQIGQRARSARGHFHGQTGTGNFQGLCPHRGPDSSSPTPKYIYYYESKHSWSGGGFDTSFTPLPGSRIHNQDPLSSWVALSPAFSPSSPSPLCPQLPPSATWTPARPCPAVAPLSDTFSSRQPKALLQTQIWLRGLPVTPPPA